MRGSFFLIPGTKDAIARKRFFSSYLCRDILQRAGPHVQTLSLKFLGVLNAAALDDKDKVVNLSKGFRCLTSDVIMDFMLHKALRALDPTSSSQ